MISQLIKYTGICSVINAFVSEFVAHTKKNFFFHSIDVDQFLGSIKATLGSLLERYTGAKITDKLGCSILATLFRQQVLHSCCDLNGFVFCFSYTIIYLTPTSLVVLVDHFSSGAVLSGHPSQFTAEELLFSGGAAQKSLH